MKVVMVGLGTAAFASLLAIKKHNKSAEITIIDKKDFDLLHACGLPFAFILMKICMDQQMNFTMHSVS